MGRNGKFNRHIFSPEYPQPPRQLTTEHLLSVIDSLFIVFQRADDANILTRKVVPQDFHEADPVQIIHSLPAYIKAHPKQKTLSISEKYQGRRYSNIYSLHHDIKAVCSLEIVNHPVGSSAYDNIDIFYRFSTDLILREASRYHFVLSKAPAGAPSEIQTQIQDDFAKISTTTSRTGEIFTHTLPEPESDAGSDTNTPNGFPSLYNLYLPQPPTRAKKQPLFSSLTGKSEVDPRPTVVPDPYGLAKSIPINTAAASNTTSLQTLSPAVSKIPPPYALPTEIIANYFHAIWYTTPIPSWLSYRSKIRKPAVESSLLKGKHNDDLRLVSRIDDSYASFAPVVDTRGAAVPLDLKNLVWLSHIGRPQIEEYKAQYYRTKEVASAEAEAPKEEPRTEAVPEVVPEKVELPAVDDKKNLSIDIASLMQWAPGNMAELESIRQERQAITQSSALFARVITTTLLRLDKLRQERYFQSSTASVIPPTQTEIRLYNKATKLILLFIEVYGVSASDLALRFSKKLPVLVADYSGTLPGMLAIRAPAVPGKSARLPSIRGPYKKRNKLQ